jgi:hypothetical protein
MPCPFFPWFFHEQTQHMYSTCAGPAVRLGDSLKGPAWASDRKMPDPLGSENRWLKNQFPPRYDLKTPKAGRCISFLKSKQS